MNHRKPVYISYAGPALLETPLLNKGSAFSKQERLLFNLVGLLPPRYETIEEQVERAYKQYRSFAEPINQHIYLRAVQDTNETLFYRLVSENLVEMLPIIYTPTVGEACQDFCEIYRSARGIFVSYEERESMDDILRSVTKDKVKVIVVTDGERVLGLGDQGIGGMGIAIGKLSLYTSCGGISPAYTLPVALDVGTNNKKLLDDPFYMGIRRPRIGTKAYHQFVDQFIHAAQERWPGVLIQFEDFAQPNAMPILQRHRERVCCFNDDIQGTAAVTLGSLLSACRKKGQALREQRIVFVGSGSAGCGIAELIIRAMINEGLSDQEARERIYMVDRQGLLTAGMPNLLDFQERLVHPQTESDHWLLNKTGDYPNLMDVIANVKPSVLIGVSGKAGLFTESLIRLMHANCPQPIVFPLSNPSLHVEAHPADIIEWTEGHALVATGSPFEPVLYKGNTYSISQCNNSYVFPGIGLGIIACGARLVSDEMLMVASTMLATIASEEEHPGAILPPLTSLSQISRRIAFKVAKRAQEQTLAREMTDEELLFTIERNFWKPVYRDYKRIATRAR